MRNISLRKKIALWVFILFAVYTVAGFLIVPLAAKRLLIKTLAGQLHREVAVQKITFNPYKLSANVTGFVIRDRETPGRFLSIEDLYINLQASSLYKKGLILKEITIEGPYINIVRYEDSLYNFSDMLADSGKGETPAAGSGPFRFAINNIRILNGSLDFNDGQMNTVHKVRDLTITLPMLSNFPYHIETFVQPVFKASINGTDFSVKGKTKPFSESLETVVDLDIRDFDLPHYISYIPYKLNFRILSGTINAKNSITFTQYSDRPSTLALSGDVSLHDLKIVDMENRPLIDIPLYSLSEIKLDLSSKELTIGEVYSNNGGISLRRYKDGTFNLQRLLPKLAKKLEEDGGGKEEIPWVIQVTKLAYDDYTIKLEDLLPSNSVNLAAGKINLRAKNISTRKNSRGSLSYSFEFNDTGTVSAESSFSINPVSADVTLRVKDISIVPFQPYITDRINILLTGGRVSTDGIFSYAETEEGKFKAAYNGKASLSKFSSVDKPDANDFVKWDLLAVRGISLELVPLKLIIDEVALMDFYSRLIINPDGSLNVRDILRTEAHQEEGLPEDGETEDTAEKRDINDRRIKINAVTLQAGSISFSDRHIKPEYSANLLDIGGRISGLSSEEGTTADLDLGGNLENHSPLEIRGRINPLTEDLYVDLKLDFKDMDLSPLTPYAKKYAGYPIQKGRLSLDLEYLIANGKLESGNNIYLDQFTLGERVNSPDATKLPVRLAISLLKDSQGEISLALPVSGNIDDPEFRPGRVILKMLKNILVKAATSPFSLLGSLVGSGEELSYIDFDYGSSDIQAPQKARLDKLISALSERPELDMEIGGFADIKEDREGLRQFTFINKLKALKLKEKIGQGEKAASLDRISIGPDEYETYLKKAFKAEIFPKPKDVPGTTKELSAPEMEKLMLANTVITDDDLRLLAMERALNVKDYLLKSGRIDRKRIFLTEPESLRPVTREGIRDSRVDFRLK